MTQPAHPAPRRSPYQGLEPYTEADYAYFFGRDQEITTIAANLSVARLTLFYGPSGVGKSSVLRAGVLHQLQQQVQANLAAEGRPQIIPVYFKQWHDNPLIALTRQIQRSAGQLDPALASPPPVADAALPPFATLVARLTEESDSDLLLILDQFEEYFLYAATPGADDFAQALIEVVNSPALRVNFLLGLREDALARLDHFKGRIPFLLDNRLTMPRLSYVGAQAAIEQPLAQWSDDQGRAYTIEPALTAAILDQLTANTTGLARQGQGAPGQSAAGIETPYLQLVLDRLWAEEQGAASSVMRLATLTRLHDTPAIVANYLNATMAHLTDDERALAARFFDRLVTPSGSKVALAHADLLRFAGAAAGVVEPLVQILLRQRILQAIPSLKGETHYEITHDVLGQAILAWQERYFTEIAETEQLAKEQAGRIEAERRTQLEMRARQQAQLQAKAEQRINRRLRWLTTVIGILLVISFSLFLCVGSAQLEANLQKNEAQRQAVAAATAQKQAEESAIEASQQALEARRQALEARRQAQIASIRQLSAQSDAAVPLNYSLSLLLALEAINNSEDTKDIRFLSDAMTTLHARLEEQPGALPLIEHQDTVNTLSSSTNGEWLASGSEDKTIRIWRIGESQTKPIVLHGHEAGVKSVRFSRNDEWLASGSEDKTIRIWRVGEWQTKPIILHGHTSTILTVAFSPDGQWLVSGSQDSTIRVWRVGEWMTQPIILDEFVAPVESAVFSYDGQWLASGSWDGTLRLWRTGEWETEPTIIPAHESVVYSLAFSPNGQWLVSGDYNGILQARRVGEWQAESVILHKGLGAIKSLAFSADGQWLASGNEDTIVRIWKVDEWQIEPLELRGHMDAILSVVFTENNQWVVSSGRDKSLRRWRVNQWAVEPEVLHKTYTETTRMITFSADNQWLASGSIDGLQVWQTNQWPEKPILLQGNSAAFSSDSQWLASGSKDEVKVWQVGKWHDEPMILQNDLQNQYEYRQYVKPVAFSLDNQWLASVSADKVRIWQVDQWQKEPVAVLLDNSDSIFQASSAITFSPDNQWLAIGHNHVQVWQVGKWQEEPTILQGYSTFGYLGGVSFSPDSQWLVGGRSSELKVWRVGSWQVAPIALEGYSQSVAFSPDSQWLASGGENGIKIWRVGKWQEAPIVLEGYSQSVAFSPDSQWLASGSKDETLRIWQVDTWQTGPALLRGHEDGINLVTFSPNGRWLVSDSQDKTVRIWTWSVTQLVDLACDLSGRNFTLTEWQQYFRNTPYRITCPQWPVHPSVVQAASQ